MLVKVIPGDWRERIVIQSVNFENWHLDLTLRSRKVDLVYFDLLSETLPMDLNSGQRP